MALAHGGYRFDRRRVVALAQACPRALAPVKYSGTIRSFSLIYANKELNIGANSRNSRVPDQCSSRGATIDVEATTALDALVPEHRHHLSTGNTTLR
jgi:hypothetical protein